MNISHGELTVWGLSKVRISKTATVLDIGCGGSQTLKTLSNKVRNGKIYGIDYSGEAVAASVRQNLKDIQAGKMAVTRSGVSSMPFSDNFFDVITAFQTHYFWPHLKNDIKEIFRVLKFNGTFLLVSELNKIDYHMTEYKTPESLKDLFAQTGFSEINVCISQSVMCLTAIK